MTGYGDHTNASDTSSTATFVSVFRIDGDPPGCKVRPFKFLSRIIGAPFRLWGRWRIEMDEFVCMAVIKLRFCYFLKRRQSMLRWRTL